jgi:PAS domain S-box-containing protein
MNPWRQGRSQAGRIRALREGAPLDACALGRQGTHPRETKRIEGRRAGRFGPIQSVLLILFLVAPAFAQPAAQRSVRVVMDNNYPPFAFTDNDGQLQGILVDEWRLWEKAAGIKAEIQGMDWAEAQRRMKAGEFDVIDTIFKTDERAGYLDFSKPYARIEVPIFFRKDISGITDLESVKGFPVATKAGDATVDSLKQKGITTLVLFSNYQAVIEAAKQHKVNVFVVDAPPAHYFLNKLGIQNEFRQSAPVNVGEFHRAVRKGDLALLKEVEGGFASLKPADLTRIEEKWYGTAIGGHANLRYVGYAAVSGLLLIVALAVWNLTLNRLVNLRTGALQASESRLRAVLDHIPDWVWLKDTHSRYVTANVSYAQALKCTLETLPGRTDAEVWPKRDVGRLVADDQAVIQSGQLKRVTEKVTDAEGNVRWLETLKAPVRSAEGVTMGTVGIARDITERKQAEAELRRTNRTLHMLSECNQVLVRASDEAELLEAVCRLVVEVGGYRMVWVGFAEQDEARSVRPVAQAGFETGYLDTVNITWADTDRGRGPTGTAIRTGQVVIARNILTDPAFGPWRQAAIQRGYAATATLPLKRGDHVLGALMVYAAEPDTFDAAEVGLLTELADDLAFGITALRMRLEHERVEEALKQSEKKYRSIFENSPIAIFQSTVKGRLLSANVAGVRMFGYESPEDLLASAADIPRQLFVSPEQRQKIMREVLQCESFVCNEVEYRRKDGSIFIANLYMRAVRDEGGEAAFLEGFVEDITERKRAEQGLRQSHERARALSSRLQSVLEDERTRIAREIHDHLGQLLTALKLELYSIERKVSGMGPADLQAVLRGRVASARELADEVIGSIQTFASELRPGVLDRVGLGAAVEAEAQTFQSRTGIHCAWSLPKEPLALPQDQATAMFRIFQEILTNVARHAQATELTIRLSRHDGNLMLEANDNGIGIRPEDVENPKSLGLLGMQERAAMLGGEVAFRPGPGKGTTVTVRIPLERKAEHEP